MTVGKEDGTSIEDKVRAEEEKACSRRRRRFVPRSPISHWFIAVKCDQSKPFLLVFSATQNAHPAGKNMKRILISKEYRYEGQAAYEFHEEIALIPLLQSAFMWQESHGVGVLCMMLLLFFLIILLPFSLLFRKRTGDGNLNFPPSPPKLPLIGNLHQVGTLPHRSFQALTNRYGPILLLNLGSAPALVVSSPELVKEMFKKQDIAFSNRFRATNIDLTLNGCPDLAFSPYGAYWREIRKMCVQELLTQQKVELFQFHRDEEVDILIKDIRRSSLKGEVVNVSDLLINVTTTIVCRSILGQRCVGEDGKSQWGELSKKILLEVQGFTFRDFFPSLGWLDNLTGLIQRLKKVTREVDLFFERVIEERKKLKTDGNLSATGRNFIDILLQLKEDGLYKLDLNQETIRAILMDMFIGATDTTMSTLEWAMTELMRQPNIMKKAQQEVQKVVGKKPKIDAVDVNKMSYLKCVVKETLRLHAPVPLLLPRETAATARLGGYDIPFKARVYVNAWAIQRDPKVWDSAEEFIPERFENKNSTDIALDPDFKFVVFGGGRRACAGMSFGLTTIEYVLANLLYWFDWKLPAGVTAKDLDTSEIFALTIMKKVPLYLLPISRHDH